MNIELNWKNNGELEKRLRRVQLAQEELREALKQLSMLSNPKLTVIITDEEAASGN